MTTVRVKENEPFEVALRRFKRTIEKLGLLTDLRAREFHEKPTAERRRKKAAAVKRHFKRVRSMQLPKKLFSATPGRSIAPEARRLRASSLLTAPSPMPELAMSLKERIIDDMKNQPCAPRMRRACSPFAACSRR